MHQAFLSGLATSSVVIGLLCLAGAVVAAFALPGRVSHPPVQVERAAVPQVA